MDVYKGMLLSAGGIDIDSYLARGEEKDILKECYVDLSQRRSKSFWNVQAMGGNVGVMKWMVDAEPDECKWSMNLFSQAAQSGNIPMMELCL